MKSMFGILILIVLLSGCSTTQVAPSRTVQRFNTQAVYQDKRHNKTQQMNLEVVARKNQNMRIDAKVILGVHIASVVMNPDRVQVALSSNTTSASKSFGFAATSFGFSRHAL